jgi:hypothetical protein
MCAWLGQLIIKSSASNIPAMPPCMITRFYLISIGSSYFLCWNTWYHGWGTVLQAGRSRVWFPLRSLISFFSLPNPSSCTKPWGWLSL